MTKLSQAEVIKASANRVFEVPVSAGILNLQAPSPSQAIEVRRMIGKISSLKDTEEKSEASLLAAIKAVQYCLPDANGDMVARMVVAEGGETSELAMKALEACGMGGISAQMAQLVEGRESGDAAVPFS